MKRRLTSMLLAICMIITIMPTLIGNVEAATADSFVSQARGKLGASASDLNLSGSWCGKFLHLCANEIGMVADGIYPDLGDAASVGKTANWFAKRGQLTYFYQENNIYGGKNIQPGNYVPQPGDVVFFNYKNRTKADGPNGVFQHIAVVYASTGTTISVYHGNWGATVTRSDFSFTTANHQNSSKNGEYDAIIGAYARPGYNSSSNSSGATSSPKPDINMKNAPAGTLTPGASVYTRGTISSDYNITSATAEVKTVGGEVKLTKTIYPNKKTVDILNDGLDSLKFGTLPNGSYVYIVTAYDSAGASNEYKSYFVVGTASPEPSSLKINMTNAPSGTLTPGASVYTRGTISSNYNIISATAEVRTVGDDVKLTKTVYPNKKSVDILNDGLDSLKFGSLANGSYIYTVTATDSTGTIKSHSNNFCVGRASTVTITFNPGASATTPVTSKTVTYGEPYGELPIATRPSDEKYDYLSFTWFTYVNGEELEVRSNDIVTITEDCTFYAMWYPSPAKNNGNTSTSQSLTASVIHSEKSENIDVGVKLEWPAVDGFDYYRVFRASKSGGYSYPLTDFAINGTSFIDVKIQPDQQYYYIVRPLISEGNAWEGLDEELGEASNEVTVHTALEIEEPEELEEETSEKCYILMQIGNAMMDVNGVTVEVDPGKGTAPTLRFGRTMLPIRATTEAMSGTVGWNSADSKVTLNANGSTVEMWINKMDYRANGETLEMDIAPYIKNERTMLPLRFVAANLNCQVTWMNKTSEILIVFYGKANSDF